MAESHVPSRIKKYDDSVCNQCAAVTFIAEADIHKGKIPKLDNVIQIRMTERELELKYVPVSFFVKKTEKKG